MEDDFLQELGYLSLATRLKRVSERMIHSGRDLYKLLGLDIEPNWYMIFKLLKAHHQLAVTEISSRLQLSHPSVISIIEKMTKKGYLETARCPNDGRKLLISLSKKAQQELPSLEVIWQAGIDGLAQMPNASEILASLDKLETAIAETNFKDRTLENLKTPQGTWHH